MHMASVCTDAKNIWDELTLKLSFENNIVIIALFGDSGKKLEAFLVLFVYYCRGCSLPVPGLIIL